MLDNMRRKTSDQTRQSTQESTSALTGPVPMKFQSFNHKKSFADLRVTIMKLVTSYWARKHRRKAYQPRKLCQKQPHLCPGCGLPVQKISWHRSLWHCIFCFVLIVTLTMHGQPEESEQQYE